MTKEEVIGVRPSEFSEWHRKLSPDCYATDIDMVEWRIRDNKLVIVGAYGVTGGLQNREHILASSDAILKRSKHERELLQCFGKNMRCKSFFVIHTIDLKLFYVLPLYPVDFLNGMPTWFNEDDFKEFIEYL